MARQEGSSLRKLAARRESKIGPKVSGRKKTITRVTAANMTPIQKVQRQPMVVEQKPDTIGAKRGPNTVV